MLTLFYYLLENLKVAKASVENTDQTTSIQPTSVVLPQKGFGLVIIFDDLGFKR